MSTSKICFFLHNRNNFFSTLLTFDIQPLLFLLFNSLGHTLDRVCTHSYACTCCVYIFGRSFDQQICARHFSNKQYNYYTILHYIALYVLVLYYSCCVAMAMARYNILYTLHCTTAAGQAQYSYTSTCTGAKSIMLTQTFQYYTPMYKRTEYIFMFVQSSVLRIRWCG